MDYKICFVISLTFLILSIGIAVIKGKSASVWIRILSVGVIFASIALLFPLPILQERSVAISILGALQASSLNAPYDDFLSLVKNQKDIFNDITFYYIYKGLLSALFLISPILFGGMVFTFFDGFARFFKHPVHSVFRDVYYFSELNECSISLAESVKEKAKPSLIVFYNVLKENQLRDKARDKGYILYKKSGYGMKFYGRRMLYFFEVSNDMACNVSSTQQLIQRFSKVKSKKRIKIYLFTRYPEAEIIMDATDKQGLSVTIINEPVTMVYNLLFNKPLYEALMKTGDNKLSILAIGAGAFGFEFVKAAAWCGQMESVPLEINVIDKEAGLIESKLKMECPELLDNEYGIRFITADTCTLSFEEALGKYCRDANYIVISLGSDELNINTALFIRGYYLRSSVDFNRKPLICVNVSNRLKHNIIPELTAINRERLKEKNWNFSSDKAQNYELHPFGAFNSVYSYDAIVGSLVERLAVNVNAVYERIMDESADELKIRRSFNACEANKRSSRANAVHILYKLYSLGFEIEECDSGNKESEEALKELKSLLSDTAVLQRLAEMEHYRWNAFQRGEGFRAATVNEAETYKVNTNGSHINRLAKLHACICSWEDLTTVAERFDKKMINYDIELIKNIPAIIGAEKNERLNIEEINYRLVKLHSNIRDVINAHY